MNLIPEVKPKAFGHKELAGILNSLISKVNSLETEVSELKAEKEQEEKLDFALSELEQDEKDGVQSEDKEEPKQEEQEAEEEVLVVPSKKGKSRKG